MLASGLALLSTQHRPMKHGTTSGLLALLAHHVSAMPAAQLPFIGDEVNAAFNPLKRALPAHRSRLRSADTCLNRHEVLFTIGVHVLRPTTCTYAVASRPTMTPQERP